MQYIPVARFFILIVFSLCHTIVFAQNTRSLLGTEFWMTFTENLYAPKDSVIHILVAPTLRDTIKVYNPQLNITESFPVNPGVQNKISVLNKSTWYSTLSFGPTGTAVRITSKYPVQVYAVNQVDGSMDISSILPVTVLQSAKQYLVNNGAGDVGKQSQVAVIAMDTGLTEIEITAGSDLTGLGGKGTVLLRKLKFGQVFMIQALSNQDLAGTFIRVVNSCKKIAVFCGSKCTAYPGNTSCGSCDALYEQLWPISYAQLDFFVPSMPGNSSYTVKVLATSDNTNLTVNGIPASTLLRGETYEKVMNGHAIVSADKPILVMQLMHSNGCNGASPSSNGDPSIVHIAGTNQTVNQAYAQVFRAAQFQHHLVACFEQKNQPVAYLNGALLTTSNFQSFISGTRQFWIAIVPVTFNKTWQFTSDSGFTLYQYGMAPNISYANVAGASFERTDADFTLTPALVCNPNDKVNFTSKGDSLGNITWYFGDGTTAMGANTQHAYGKTGTFKVVMSNDRSSSCADSISRIVTVLQGPTALLPKDTVLCEGNSLRVELPTNLKFTYAWDNGSNSFFQTFSSTRTAILTISDTNNCVFKDTIKVTISECDDYDLKLANVFTPGTDGFNDNWVVYYKGYQKIHVQIYNRWGAKVADYNLPDDDHWNGQVDHQFIECPAGVYFYQIEAVARKSSKNKSVHGSIELIRN